MNVLMVGLQMAENSETDLDDTHCIVANLIFEGKIKGYISLNHQKLVLSKLDPFPKLTSISWSEKSMLNSWCNRRSIIV